MYCKQCGKQLPDGVQFCTSCGAKTDAAPVTAKTASTAKTKKTPLVIAGVVVVALAAVLVFHSGDAKEEPMVVMTEEETETVVQDPEEILIGTWGSDEDSSVALKFREDGSVAVSGLGLDVGSEKVTYTADEDTITLKLSAYGISTDFDIEYELSEDQDILTITANGVSMKLNRK